MPDYRIISADSHMTEPADLWVERLDLRFRDRAPRVVRDYKRDIYLFIAPGIVPFPIAAGFGAGKKDADLKAHLRRGYEGARPGGWDPSERLKDQDIDGISAEVLYPTHGMLLFGMVDAELQQACFRVYNAWIAEFVKHDRRRFHALAVIPLNDVIKGVAELEYANERGLKGAMIWCSPPEDKPYSNRIYDPFWNAAAELHMPVSLHVLTSLPPQYPKRAKSPFLRYLSVIYDAQRSLTDIVCGGVLERFPELKVVSGENDIGWFPHFLFRLDHAYEKFGKLMNNPLSMRPSDYIKRQVYATFQEDPIGPLTHRIFGEDNYMWASDYPHADSTWPESAEAIAQTFAGIPSSVTRKMVGENVAKLYKIATY